MQKVGSFQIENGIIISDPCYDFNVDEYNRSSDQKYFPKKYIMTGEWNGYVKYCDNGRIAELQTCHSSIDDNELTNAKWELCKGSLGVDTGQMGVFDSKYFKDDNIVGDYPIDKSMFNDFKEKGDRYYAMCCYQTYNKENPKKQAGIIPYGVVSSSGYGDGSYNYSVIKKNGLICGFKIVFIDSDECSNSDCSF
ncbi:hypothetical protein Klosneuvirus_15_7 [Klosneuvirus KNV1]|uniref:Uncharacterized protein n=1 Tax=Klosneuvirus KNV1 TaxID=1977640 RepID=A0A1V0SLV1_9VIRU|nr:hypothetical protein Klosneuvirus_15_7 [Klosneuvirus KNV1]